MASSQLKTKLHYTFKGKVISTKAFIKRIDKAEAEIKAGKFLTVDELEKESEKW